MQLLFPGQLYDLEPYQQILVVYSNGPLAEWKHASIKLIHAKLRRAAYICAQSSPVRWPLISLAIL